MKVDTQSGHRLTKEFIADLESVFLTCVSDDIAIYDLKGLEKKLMTWGKDCNKALKGERSKLPKDHPVNCPISLYGVMDRGRLEVAHTRTLAWLLNPKEKHRFGTTLLESLLSQLELKRPLLNVEVEAEVRRKNDDGSAGRLDIVVKGSGNEMPWQIVIEAKIDAPHDDQQLERYKNRQDTDRVFLTPEGNLPNGTDGWVALSFVDLARAFLETSHLLRGKPGYDFFRLYIAGVLKDILDLPIGGLDDENENNRYKLLGFLKTASRTPITEKNTMPTSNRALGFYINNWQKMEALYNNADGQGKDALLEILPKQSKREIQEMIEKVGTQAYKQAADLLLKIYDCEICEHFSETLGCRRNKVRTRRATIEDQWWIEFRLQPSGSRKSGEIFWTAGAFIDYSHVDRGPAIFLYIWTHGGREAEEYLAKLLGKERGKGQADAAGSNAGTVVFGKILLKEKVDNKTFNVEEDELLKEVRALLQTVRKRDVDKLFKK